MIEDRLKETLDRVAGGGPDEAGGFDRFLRHRVRRSRRVAAATALCLFLVLVLAVVLLDPRRSSDDAATPAALGTAEEAHWTPGPLVAAAPLQGFEIHVPTGWEVNRTWQGFELRPISEELRRELPTPIQVGTFALDPADHPQGAELFQDHNEFAGDISGTIGEYNTRTTGSFHDGRWWLRTDGGAPGHRTTSWYTPWPYHCQGGEPWPDVLALRTLRVVLLDAGDRVWAQAMELAPTLLRTARPVTNAVTGRAYAPPPGLCRRRDRPALRYLLPLRETFADGANCLALQHRFRPDPMPPPAPTPVVLPGGRPAGRRDRGRQAGPGGQPPRGHGAGAGSAWNGVAVDQLVRRRGAGPLRRRSGQRRPAAVRGRAQPVDAAGLCRPVQALEAQDRGMGE